ncbi:amino acid adenylation domain-containing protein [Bradyrhizobium ontarionense]|uniref:Amino acid adenylation domain-containing protein n=1 Tax=Bradyrhizobium ontarionense TaxID=2898149 RepID=A0ABY3R814_9BRAD|nr:non-ribosomal peptide synthetase [Bradyrhizobium sp. A19]UFZ03298.1 amino acid adenylation domain-containing protein [Bradyrhizobium sp. A19]
MSGSKVSARISDLSSAQRALLEQRIRGTSSDVGGNESRVQLNIPRRAEGVVTPLSLAQEGLWLLTQAMPDTAAYNNFGSLRLRGELNREALAASLTEVVRRHEVLRTRFGVIDGVPAQVVLASTPLSLDVTDFTGVAKSEQLRVVRNWAIEQGRRPLDLAQGEVFRAHLLQLDVNVHVFLLTVHHIVSDGWSFGLLFRELLLIYNALSQQQDVRLAPLPIQYGDYAAWQRNQLHGSHQEMLLVYWREKLHGVPLLLDLPTDRPRPPVRSLEGDWLSFELPPDLTERIRIFCRQQRVTLFMVLLGAYAVLLQRCSGSRDVLIGSPVADRPFPEVEGLIGLFVNTLVFRADFADDPTVAEFISRIRTETVRTYEHRTMPFDSLIGALRIPREQSHSPVFQTTFALQPPRSVPLSVRGLEVTPATGVYTGSRFDLTLAVDDSSVGLMTRWDYSRDIFDASTVGRLARLYTDVLDAITAAAPNARVSDLPLKTLTDTWTPKGRPVQTARVPVGADGAPGGVAETLSSRFAMQVKMRPRAMAVVDEGWAWTYAELDAEANRVAMALRAEVAGRGAMVALLFEHSAPMIAGILGILKAGCAYVPLNPSHPPERLRFILQDTGAVALVTAEKSERVREICGSLPLIVTGGALAECAGSLPNRTPESLAYVLYTSGTTGRPKGVVQNDRNVLYFIDAYAAALSIKPEDRLSLIASYGFDAAVMDIFAALLNGASLYLRDLRRSGYSDMSRWIERCKLTIWHATPTVFRLVTPGLTTHSSATLRLVVLGGEEALPADRTLLKAHLPRGCTLVNGYGPTEATLVSQQFMRVTDEQFDSVLPIGFPAADTDVVLLDHLGHPTELVGEIGVRTPHVALGYLNAPALTAERFVPSPFGEGERIYRTGDLARRRWDGRLEFLGRRDDQIKIRGHRVEPGEVAAILTGCVGVGQAAVLAKGDSPDDKHLVAFVVPTRDRAPDRGDILEYLRRQLPEYLVPTTVIFLDQLPLSQNGKVDRRALLAMPLEEAPPRPSSVAPRDATEEQIAAVWAEVLGHRSFGIDDNFFDLGGDSLRLIRVHHRLSEQLRCSMPVTKLFAYPTIRALSEHLVGARDDAESLRASARRGQAREKSMIKRRSSRKGSDASS